MYNILTTQNLTILNKLMNILQRRKQLYKTIANEHDLRKLCTIASNNIDNKFVFFIYILKHILRMYFHMK